MLGALRRNLLEGSAAGGSAAGGTVNETEGLLGAPEHWPACWLLLRAARAPGEPRPGNPAPDLALPIRIDLFLPDAIIPRHTYDSASAQRRWVAGDRFRMFFTNKSASSKSRAPPLTTGLGWVPDKMMQGPDNKNNHSDSVVEILSREMRNETKSGSTGCNVCEFIYTFPHLRLPYCTPYS
jgi:hypothetical protein